MKRRLAQEWSEALRSYRNRKGLNQAQMGALLDVDQTSVSRWERGDVLPSASVRRALATLLHRQCWRTDSSALRAFINLTSGRWLLLNPSMTVVAVSRAINATRQAELPTLLGSSLRDIISWELAGSPDLVDINKSPGDPPAFIVGSICTETPLGLQARRILAEPVCFPDGLGFLVETEVIDLVVFGTEDTGLRSLFLGEIERSFPIG